MKAVEEDHHSSFSHVSKSAWEFLYQKYGVDGPIITGETFSYEVNQDGQRVTKTELVNIRIISELEYLRESYADHLEAFAQLEKSTDSEIFSQNAKVRAQRAEQERARQDSIFNTYKQNRKLARQNRKLAVVSRIQKRMSTTALLGAVPALIILLLGAVPVLLFIFTWCPDVFCGLDDKQNKNNNDGIPDISQSPGINPQESENGIYPPEYYNTIIPRNITNYNN